MPSKLLLLSLVFVGIGSVASADTSFNDLCKSIDSAGQSAASSPSASNLSDIPMPRSHLPTDVSNAYDFYTAKIDGNCKLVALRSDLKVDAPLDQLIIGSGASFVPLYKNCNGNFTTHFFTQTYTLKRDTRDVALVSVQCNLNAPVNAEEAAFKAYGLELKFDPGSPSSPAQQRVEIPAQNRGVSSVSEEPLEPKSPYNFSWHFQRSCPMNPVAPVCK